MVVKIYVSGISGNKEVKKKQQRVQMILESKSIVYEAIDITEPGREKDKETMQSKSKVREVLGKHPLPPQLFNDEEYCGDYEDFDLANEVDGLEAFLHLPIPSKLISCDNDTITAKVNGSREGVAEVTNGASAEKVNGDVELTSVNCDGDVTASATDAVSPPVEGEEATVDDATPEENIVNSSPDETPEIAQTSQNEIVEEDKENETDIDATGEKTDDDRLDEGEKVEDENNDDEQIAQHENEVTTPETKIEDIVTEQISQQEKDVPNTEIEIEDTKSEQISLQEKDVPKDEIKIENIVSEQIAQQENDLPNAEIKIEDFVSENKKFDHAEDIGVDKKGLMPALKNKASDNLNNDNKLTSSNDVLGNVEKGECKATIDQEKDSNIKPEVVKEMLEKSDDIKTENDWQMPKSPVKTVDLGLNIPIDYTKERQISELEKTEPLEWVDDIDNKNKQNILLIKTQEHKKSLHEGLDAVKQNTEQENTSDLKNDSAAKSSSLEKESAEKPGDRDATTETAILMTKSAENEETKHLADLSITKKESSSSKSDKDTKKEDECKKIGDASDSISTDTSTEVHRKVDESMTDKIVPSQEGIESDKIEMSIKTKIKPEDIIDAASSSPIPSKELTAGSQKVPETAAEAVIITSAKSDYNILIMPSPEENKTILSESSDKKKIEENLIQKEDSEEDPIWEGKRLCRRDTLKKIKRPSLPLLRPSSIKEESLAEISKNQCDGSKNECISKHTVENPNISQSIVVDINLNECPVELSTGGKQIDQSLKSPDGGVGTKNISSGSSNSTNATGNNQNPQQTSSGSVNSSASQGRTGSSTSSSPQNSPSGSQNNNLSNSSAGGSINMSSTSTGNSVGQGTSTSGSLNIQLEDASGQITNLEEIQLPNSIGEKETDGAPKHPPGVPMKELLKENYYVSPFSVDKIAYSPQLVSKIKSDSLKRDEKGVVLPNWDHRPSEVDLVKQVRYLLDERDTEIAISRARMRAGRSPLRDPHHHFVLEMKRMINKYKEEEEEVDWPVVPPPRPPTPPPPEPPVNEFLEEVLRALNAPYIPKPPPEEPQKNVFLSQVQVLLDSEQMTGDSQATFFQKERGPVEDPEFVHKVRIMLNERESTLGLKPMEHPEKRDHNEFLSEVFVLLEGDPSDVPDFKPIEAPVLKVEPEPEKEEVIVEEPTPTPIVEEKLKTPTKQVKEKPNTKTEEDLPKKKEIEIAQIFIRDNIFPVTAQVSSDNFKIYVSALDSQRIELKNEDLDALTITVIEDNGYKSDVAKIVVSPNL